MVSYHISLSDPQSIEQGFYIDKRLICSATRYYLSRGIHRVLIQRITNQPVSFIESGMKLLISNDLFIVGSHSSSFGMGGSTWVLTGKPLQ